MKFTVKDSNVNIELGTMITLAVAEEEKVETAHLLVVRTITPLIPLPAYQLVNLDDTFAIPNFFEDLKEVEEFIGVLVEEKGHKIIRVTDNNNVKIVVE